MIGEDASRMFQAYCTAGTLNYTKYFFKKLKNKRFIVSDHHISITDVLDGIVDGKYTKVIFNIAPRYAKTELVVKTFMGYGFAINPACNFIHLSYSDDLALSSSEEVREIVKSAEYRELFPYVQIKRESDSKKKWLTTAGGGVYATSTGGQVTGFGAGTVDEEEDFEEMLDSIASTTTFSGALIIDDPIKPDDALNDKIRDKVNKRFETTIRNRVNSRRTPIIIVMQRLHEDDLCGYLQRIEPGEWLVVSLPCLTVDENGNEKALWPMKHTVKELHEIQRKDPYVFDTQYQQNPTPIEGLMYRPFRTYEVIPYCIYSKRKNYTDTADTGSDYLCSICYEEHPDYNYVTDILYTKKPMEYTEPKTAEMLAKNKTEDAVIESNNGGRGFARNVEKQMHEMKFNKCRVSWFFQSKNKNVRIFSNSADVNNVTLFPIDWDKRWPDFFHALMSYRKEGTNSHDDAPDALTGTVEQRNSQPVALDIDKDDLGIM